jgi:hypothetical protein
MRIEHKQIQIEIKKRYKQKFDVFVEAEDGKNSLPNRELHVYEPDIVVKRKNSNEILYIIEVENDPMRKILVGASILADYSTSQLKEIQKPILIFIVYTNKGINQIHNFVEKLKIAKKYCNNLKEIKIFSINEFWKEDLSHIG